MRSPEPDLARLLALVDRFHGRRVAVAGDLIADEFIYGRSVRVSREAPVLILNYDSTEIVPGGAGNAARNIAALGGLARPVGLAGRDETGRRLVGALGRGVSKDGILQPPGYRTPRKTRILAGGIHSAKQQVVRIDRDSGNLDLDAVHPRLIRHFAAAIRSCDALLVSDYGTGLITPALVTQALGGRRRRHLPVFVDSRYDLLRFHGMTACTPNESEVEQLLGIRIGDSSRALERAGRRILAHTRSRAVLVTRGSRGMALFEPGVATRHIGIFGSDQVTDVTGAGDTVIATITLAVAAGGSFYEAARLANYAGGLVVMKRGTATVSADELREAVRADLGG